MTMKATPFFEQGLKQSRQGDYWGAITSFDQALQSNLENADLYGHRCVARHRVGDVAGAIADCQQAAALYLEQGNNEKYNYALNMLDQLGGIT
jgi:Flp pilus assembly protein TadD